MSPSKTEIYHPESGNWISFPILNPSSPPASMSDNKEDGTRDVYLFECSEDDSHSTLYRSKAGFDAEISSEVRELYTEGFEIIKQLKRGDEPYIMTIKTDKSQLSRKIRFSHI